MIILTGNLTQIFFFFFNNTWKEKQGFGFFPFLKKAPTGPQRLRAKRASQQKDQNQMAVFAIK